jgi:hypothetical protein
MSESEMHRKNCFPAQFALLIAPYGATARLAAGSDDADQPENQHDAQRHTQPPQNDRH